MASPGDWPWHVALYRDETHVCDGTLVSADWVLTTESCFQGQPKATWMAVFGAVRLNANAPWTQRRRIVGMIKSPVEGSTAALIRMETAVVYSDFIRPICLPDQVVPAKIVRSEPIASNHKQESPRSEKLNAGDLMLHKQDKRSSPSIDENREFFITPSSRLSDEEGGSGGVFTKEYSAEFVDEQEQFPRAQAAAQFRGYVNQPKVANKYEYRSPTAVTARPSSTTLWMNCNTLGWSKQRDHLQRVQLKIGDMASCENVSIATVNSMCTEATFHKQDCTEEEFAGSPVMCMQPDGQRWALVGMASWRIACAQSGVERPRMYDMTTSNSAWIRDTINSS